MLFAGVAKFVFEVSMECRISVQLANVPITLKDIQIFLFMVYHCMTKEE